eukprot:CAMPEP_0168331974 /NCGR_PEP_ID=MMETSP0213-20121227/8677_1 /TAXON_ID=151035 /ORGANISM="Euplotes harpa, Strain FSP1.4" /LENGTH=202 /DNA_ID=CAMNT_0008335901 /DNA_START=889 /DNA_END=1494 /DNA_ORIENTATION=+
MRCLEYMSIECLVIFVGWIGSTEQAAAIIAFQMLSLTYRMPNGVSMASTNLVGNYLGANQADNAKMYTKASFVLTVLIVIFTDAVLIVFRTDLVRIFTQQEEIIIVASNLLIIISVMIIADFTQGCFVGTLLAMGKQMYGSVVNIISYLIFMIPLAYVSAFYFDMGVYGILTCGAFGSAFAAVAYIYIVYTTDWQQLANEIF